MSIASFLLRIAEILETPRATQDIDVVIDTGKEGVERQPSSPSSTPSSRSWDPNPSISVVPTRLIASRMAALFASLMPAYFSSWGITNRWLRISRVACSFRGVMWSLIRISASSIQPFSPYSDARMFRSALWGASAT